MYSHPQNSEQGSGGKQLTNAKHRDLKKEQLPALSNIWHIHT